MLVHNPRLNETPAWKAGLLTPQREGLALTSAQRWTHSSAR